MSILAPFEYEFFRNGFVAALVIGALCGFIGVYVVLRRMSLFDWARASLVLFLFAAFLALLVQGGKLQRGLPSAEILWRYLTMTQSGKIWLVRELYGFALFLGMWTLRKKHVSRKIFWLMGDWKPDKAERVEGRTIYLWIIPAKAR